MNSSLIYLLSLLLEIAGIFICTGVFSSLPKHVQGPIWRIWPKVSSADKRQLLVGVSFFLLGFAGVLIYRS